MFKKRFLSLSALLRIRKGVILLIMAALILGMMGLCISCTPDFKTDDSIVYDNETLGFSLKFPMDWKGKYIIKESDDNITVFNKKVYEKFDGGRLFTIERVIGELITEEDMQQAPVSQQIILQGNGYTYLANMPSDVQYPPDDGELSSDYQAMSEQITDICHSISLLGDKKPKAANEGFKVVGSSFFTVEIPGDWELKLLEETLYWNIFDGDNKVGEIQLISYKSGGLIEENAADNIMSEYLFNDETLRKIRITLYPEYADQATMGKIKDSFEFMGGPYNVIDLQSAAEEYLVRGGQKIFGKIEGFQMENGKPSAVNVKVMKFIPDDESPNGFHIEDLHRVEKYSLDFGVNVAPLVAPNYVTWGTYEIPLLDENFIMNYENYQDFFYDFIIASDGQLKIILGHYIP